MIPLLLVAVAAYGFSYNPFQGSSLPSSIDITLTKPWSSGDFHIAADGSVSIDKSDTEALNIDTTGAYSPADYPPWYSVIPYELIQDFDTLTDFTIGGSPTVAEINRTTYHEGDGSLSITTSGSNCTIDFSLGSRRFYGKADGLLRFYLPASSNYTSLTLYLGTTPAWTAGTWTYATIQGYEGVRDQATFKTGWNNLLFNRASFSGGTPTLLDDPTNVFTTARITIVANKGPIYIDSLLFGGPSKPKVLVMFDDGQSDIFQVNDSVFGSGKSAFDYMRDKKIKATEYIVPNVVGNSGYLTLAQIQALYNAGWDIANHTNTHITFTSSTDEEITAELAACDAFLEENGWHRGRKHVAYPTGAFTLDTHPALVRSLGYYTCRSIQTYPQNTQYNPTDLFNFWAHGVNSTISAVNVTDKIDAAVSAGRMFALYVHGLNAVEDATFWDPAKFKTVIDHIATLRDAGTIDVLTISEWYNRLNVQ